MQYANNKTIHFPNNLLLANLKNPCAQTSSFKHITSSTKLILITFFSVSLIPPLPSCPPTALISTTARLAEPCHFPAEALYRALTTVFLVLLVPLTSYLQVTFIHSCEFHYHSLTAALTIPSLICSLQPCNFSKLKIFLWVTDDLHNPRGLKQRSNFLL